MKTYRETCAMFKQTVISEQVYEGGTSSKTPIRSDANRNSHGRKHKGGEAASATNPNKGHASKRKKQIQAIQDMGQPVQHRHACCMAQYTSYRNVKYLKLIQKSMPSIIQIKINKPDWASNLSVVISYR